MEPIRVGLVADPAAPTEIARRMSDLEPPSGGDRDLGHRGRQRAVHHRMRGRRHRVGAAGRPRSRARVGPRGRSDRASASRRRRPLPSGRDQPAARNGGAVTARARRTPHAQAHPSRGAQTHLGHGRRHHAGRAPRAAPPPRRPLAAAAGHGARQPSLAPRAGAQVGARRGPGNRSHRHRQLHGLATRRVPVMVASHRSRRSPRSRSSSAGSSSTANSGTGPTTIPRRLGRDPVSTTPRRC